jgi:hypothetical protein
MGQILSHEYGVPRMGTIRAHTRPEFLTKFTAPVLDFAEKKPIYP